MHSDVFSAVLLQDKIFVALALPFPLEAPDSLSLLCTTCLELKSWIQLTTLDSVDFGLGTFQSKLVRVGGRKGWLSEVHGSVLVSDDGIDWRHSLPPMPTARRHPMVISTGEYLVVAGGEDHVGEVLATVEVLVDGLWCAVKPLPISCRVANHCFHHGKLFLTPAPNQAFIYSTIFCEVETLRAHCSEHAAGDKPTGVLWKTIDRDRDVGFAVHGTVKYRLDRFSRFYASLGGHLVTSKYDTPYPRQLLLFAHSPLTQSWVSAGEIPAPLEHSACGFMATVPLPRTGELVVIGGTIPMKVFKATLKSKLCV